MDTQFKVNVDTLYTYGQDELHFSTHPPTGSSRMLHCSTSTTRQIRTRLVPSACYPQGR